VHTSAVGGKTMRSNQTYRSSMSPSKLASLGDDLQRNSRRFSELMGQVTQTIEFHKKQLDNTLQAEPTKDNVPKHLQ
jgi:hypothetical protein